MEGANVRQRAGIKRGRAALSRALTATAMAALLWSPAVWGQGALPAIQVQQSQPQAVNRDLPGRRQGVLTQAANGSVSIDRVAYRLAAAALIENKSGRSFQVSELQWDGVEYPVDYWLAADASKQIIQIVIYFPE